MTMIKEKQPKHINTKNVTADIVAFETLISKKELVLAFGVSSSFVNKLMAEEDLPYFKLGRAVRFRVSDISRWLEKRRVS